MRERAECSAFVWNMCLALLCTLLNFAASPAFQQVLSAATQHSAQETVYRSHFPS